MANLSLDFDRLMDDLGVFVGWGLSSGFTAEQTALATRIVNDGYRNFLDAHYAPGRSYQWSFLEPRYEMTLTAPYTTGTVAVSSGTVTLTSATPWPAWAAQGQLVADSNTYKVDSRTNDTVIVLEDTSVTITAGTSFELQRVTYDLPDDFAGFGPGPLVIESENLVYRKSIQIISESAIRNLRDEGVSNNYPLYAAVFYKEVPTYNTADQQTQVVEFWPPADAAYVISATYARAPSALDDTNNTNPLGGPRYHACLQASVKAEAERQILDGTSQVWTSRYYELLLATINYDKTLRSPRSYGRMTKAEPEDEYTDFYPGNKWRNCLPPGDIYEYNP